MAWLLCWRQASWRSWTRRQAATGGRRPQRLPLGRGRLLLAPGRGSLPQPLPLPLGRGRGRPPQLLPLPLGRGRGRPPLLLPLGRLQGSRRPLLLPLGRLQGIRRLLLLASRAAPPWPQPLLLPRGVRGWRQGMALGVPAL